MEDMEPNRKNHLLRMQIHRVKQEQQRLTNILEVCILQSIMTDIIRDQKTIWDMAHLKEDTIKVKDNTWAMVTMTDKWTTEMETTINTEDSLTWVTTTM